MRSDWTGCSPRAPAGPARWPRRPWRSCGTGWDSSGVASEGSEESRTIGVAIPIPDPYGPELQRWRESFGDPLATSIPTHVTLLPPTPVAGPDLHAIDE